MKKKILITYASYGSGHKTVANYIYEYFKEHGDYDLKIVDVMDYASLIGKINLKLFNMIFKFQFSLPATIGYELSDNKIVTAPYKIYTKACLNKKLQKDSFDCKNNLSQFSDTWSQRESAHDAAATPLHSPVHRHTFYISQNQGLILHKYFLLLPGSYPLRQFRYLPHRIPHR